MGDDWRLTLSPNSHGDYPRADLDGARTAVSSETLWTLLRQAPNHEMTLLMPAHPSPRRLAALRSWVQACVTGISAARSQETQTADGAAEAAGTMEIATQLAAVADAFSLYAIMLEKFRIASQPEPGLSPPRRPLAVIADDERLLLNCRAALRTSIQGLMTAVETDR